MTRRRLLLAVLAVFGLASALFASLSVDSKASYASRPATVLRGSSYFYSKGMFQIVARNRGMKLRSDVDGYASVPNCRYIGQVLQARINGHDLERYQVLDCPAPWDRARHIREGLVIEVDYQSAVRNEFSRRGHAPAEVYYP